MRRALPLPCFARAFSVDDSCRDLAIVTRSFTYSLRIGIVLKLTRGRDRGRLLRGQKEIFVQSGMMYFANWGGDQRVCFC